MKTSENHAELCQAFWNRQRLLLFLVAVSGRAVSEAVKILSNIRATVGWTETCCVYCSTVIAWNSPLIALVPQHRPKADIENIWELSVCVSLCIELESSLENEAVWFDRLNGWFHLCVFVCVCEFASQVNWALTGFMKLPRRPNRRLLLHIRTQ